MKREKSPLDMLVEYERNREVHTYSIQGKAHKYVLPQTIGIRKDGRTLTHVLRYNIHVDSKGAHIEIYLADGTKLDFGNIDIRSLDLQFEAADVRPEFIDEYRTLKEKLKMWLGL